MASTFTTRIRLEKQGDGENANTWGLRLNQNTIDLVDEAVAGYETVDLDAVTSLTLTQNDGTPDQARNFGLNFIGNLTADCTVNVPAQEKIYFVQNNTTGDYNILLTPAGGTAVTVVESGNNMIVATTGTTFTKMTGFVPDSIQTDVSINANLAVTSAVDVGTNLKVSGNVSVGGNVSAASFDGDGTNVTNVTPKDNSVSTAKIVNDAVTGDKLNNTGVGAGTYGSATAAPSITVDAQGRITSASTNSFTPGWEYIGERSGSGNYDNTFSGLSGYKHIKIYFNTDPNGSDDINIYGGSSNRLIFNAVDLENFCNGQFTILNFNDSEGGSYKLVDGHADYEYDTGDGTGGSNRPIIEFLNYNEAWDRIRLHIDGGNTHRYWLYGMR